MGICGKGAREGGKTEKRQQHKGTPAAPDLSKAGVISLRALATTINRRCTLARIKNTLILYNHQLTVHSFTLCTNLKF